MNTMQYLFIRSSQQENIYGPFTGELLKVEGLNGFITVDLDKEPLPKLAAGDLIVITRCFLRESELDSIISAIEDGARIVALLPSWELAKRLGWLPLNKVIHPAWVKIREGNPGAGLPIQTHMPVAVHTPSESMDIKILADTIKADWSDAECPAVARQRIGKGEAVIFFYDLPSAVARIRFGNPDLASMVTNGRWWWTHACDMFDEHVDDRVHHLPQADFHTQLLAKALTDICAYPLARLWYYEKPEMRAAAVFQSDDDGSTPEQFAELSDCLKRHGATGTFYMIEQTLLPDETLQAMRAEGHTFAPHVTSTYVGETLYFHFPEQLEKETKQFLSRYGGPCSTSLQSHCAPWIGYQAWVPLHMKHGYRLLFVYMSVPAFRLNKYMCGSGRPLRFFDTDGTLYDSWQQPLPVFDDATIQKQVEEDPKPVIAEFEKLLSGAVGSHHSTIAILSHPISFSTYSSPYIEAVFDLLVKEGVPIYNGDQWCEFLDKRDAVRLSQQFVEDGKIHCTVSHLTSTLPLMIPLPASDGTTSISINGKPADGTIITRLEQKYLFIQLEGTSDGKDIHVHVGGIW